MRIKSMRSTRPRNRGGPEEFGTLADVPNTSKPNGPFRILADILITREIIIFFKLL